MNGRNIICFQIFKVVGCASWKTTNFILYLRKIVRNSKNLFWNMKIMLSWIARCKYGIAVKSSLLCVYTINKLFHVWQRLYDFSHAICCERLLNSLHFATLTRSFAILHNSRIKILRVHRPYLHQAYYICYSCKFVDRKLCTFKYLYLSMFAIHKVFRLS